jgi:tetratricopeptide (TPR) repeat protein
MTFDRAQCLRRMGARRDEAIALYQQYLDEAPDGKRAGDARANIAELQPQPTGDPAADTTAAREAFDAASALYSAGSYGQAYDQFTKAGELFHSPQILFDRAQCLRRMGAQRELAIALYEQFLAEAPADRRAADATFFVGELRSQGAEAR